jgi:DNA/RNA endonuclease YhcR with UshA esterase domain
MGKLTLLVGLLAIAGVAFAHHGTANYETTKSITVKGSVSDFQFINPHVIIVMDAKDETGKVQKWQGELTSPNRLSRVGWTKSSIKPGDVITVSGYPTKSGSPEIWIQKVMLSSGEELATGGGN